MFFSIKYSPEHIRSGEYFHYHLYGRSKTVVHQKYGDALYIPQRDENPDWYKDMKPLTKDDCEQIQKEINSLIVVKYPKGIWV